MKSNKGTYHFLEKGGCLSPATIQKYILGTLSKQNLHKVESHLIDCDLCCQAVDAWEVIGHEKVIAITENINAKIDQRATKISIKTIVQFAVAASIIFTIGFFTISNLMFSDTEIAQNTSVNEQSKTIVTENKSRTENSPLVIEDPEKKKNIKQDVEEVDLLKIVADNQKVYDDIEVTDDIEVEEKELELEVALEEEETVELTNDMLAERDGGKDNVVVIQEENAVTESSTDLQREYILEKNEPALFEESRDKSNKKSGRQNKLSRKHKLKNEAVANAPTVNDLSSRGVANNKEYDLSIEVLDSLIKKERKPEYIWQKANVLELKKDTAKAIILYQELINTDNSFKLKAIERLERIKK